MKNCFMYPTHSWHSNEPLTKLNKTIKHYEKVCCAQELGSYAQGQGYNQVRGQIVPKIVLLRNY